MANLAQIEEKILEFWQKNKIFEKSVKKKKKQRFFSFYDGPPFATGIPHYGHILATTIKDTVLRYWTMKGYQVPRRVGWDCHGLPIENLIEKETGIKNKREIEKFGIEKFNKLCQDSVFRCVKDFETTLKRVGRWADYQDSYATLDNNYIESVWWVFSRLWQQNLVYKDYRVIPFCPRCGTPISNFEVNQGYKDVKDNSVYLKFKITDKRFKNSYLLSWTTTPWTLPGNVALAVNLKADYVLVKEKNENLILAKNCLSILKEKYQIIKKFKGKDLVGLKYQPLFNCLEKVENIDNAFQVLPAGFVTIDEGTGIVHTAVMYGQDDFDLGRKYNLPAFHTVDQSGKFKKQVEKWAGRFVKDVEDEIIEDLRLRNILYKKEKIVHSYPFCWRCDTFLLYYAFNTWYIKVSQIKKNLIDNNKKIHWVPGHIKNGRFGKWLQGARDWAFSRNRFWGAPIPIWVCSGCDNSVAIGSIKELEKKSGKKIKNFHRPHIDQIVFDCHKCGKKMKRIEEVFDCWFESGSMPYAQWHYPFENKKFVEQTFPADFIAEGLDQTRGWFYTLHVLAAALTLNNKQLGKNQPAFKNAIVNGMILDSQGKKLSKRLRNYPETTEVFEKYGADSLRFFLLSSTPIGEDYLFSAKQVENVYRNIISTFYHSFVFFNTYKDKKFKPVEKFKNNSKLNKWILSRVNSLNKEVSFWMDKYDLTKASRPIIEFIDDFSNWYVRRSRKKMQKTVNDKEKQETSQVFYQTLIVLSKIMACFIPFITEHVYQEIKTKKDFQSIHLDQYPEVETKRIDKKLEEKMKKTREIVTLALAERVKKAVKVRQPLAELTIDNQELKNEKELLELIKDEVNVKKISFGKKLKLDFSITAELKEEGMVREIIRQIQQKRKKAGLKPEDEILVKYFSDNQLIEILDKNKEFILKEAKIKNLILMKDDFFEKENEINIDQKKLYLLIKKTC
jgi:isoleucyl-tRNA synthetase